MLVHHQRPASGSSLSSGNSTSYGYHGGATSSNSSSARGSAQPQPELFIGTFDFETSEPDQFAFKRGAILPIVLKEPSGWWAALVNGRYGWVPAAFLEPVNPGPHSLASPMSPASPSSMMGYGAATQSPMGSGGHSARRPSAHSFMSTSARSEADLPVYSEDYDDDSSSYLSPDYDDPHRLSSEGPRTPVVDEQDPLVNHLVNTFANTSLRTGSASAGGGGRGGYTPAASSYSSPTTYNNQQSYSGPAGAGGSFFSSYYAMSPPYDPPIPHQLSLVPEEGSEVNSQWSMPQTSIGSQAFSHTSSYSKKLKPSSSGGLGTGSGTTGASGSLRHGTNPSPSPVPEYTVSPTSARSSSTFSAAALQKARASFSAITWYLRPKYAWDELKLDADGLVIGGTIPALIERLTMEELNPLLEMLFRTAFLTTFKSFVSADVVFESLVGWYESKEPQGLASNEALEWKEKKWRPMQTRILSIFGLWVEKHGLLSDDPHIIPRLRTFLFAIHMPTGLALSAKQLLETIDRVQNYEMSFSATLATVSSSPFSLRKKHKPPKPDFLKWDAAEVASHLTLLEARAYSKIRPHECLAWMKHSTRKESAEKGGKGDDTEVKNLMAFVSGSDRLAMWVKNTVLSCDALGRRADVIDLWIKIAERCRNLNNIFSMSAIVAALSGGDVGKLHLTWAHVSRAAHFEPLVRLTDPKGNFSNYRSFHSQLSAQADAAEGAPNVSISSLTNAASSGALSSNAGSTTIPNMIAASTSPTSLHSLSSISSRGDGSSVGDSAVGRGNGHAPPMPACVPFISPFITELMHISDKFPSTLPTAQGPEPSQTPPRPLINVVKLTRQSEVIGNMLRFVDKPHLHRTSSPGGGRKPASSDPINLGVPEGYRVLAEKENPAMIAAMEQQMDLASCAAKKDAGFFWKRSQELQGMEVTHADIWKNLNDAGF